MTTHNERRPLLFIRSRQVRHALKNLDPRVLVHIDRVGLLPFLDLTSFGYIEFAHTWNACDDSKRAVHSRRAHLHCDEWVELGNGAGKGREVLVFVGENAKMAWGYPQAYPCGDVFLSGFKPGVTEGLQVNVDASV